jgi:hypothetical protein
VNDDQTELLGRDAVAESGEDLNAPSEWAGLPAFHPVPERSERLILSFDSAADRDRLVAELGLIIAKKTGPSWSAWWPPREREDLAALRFDFDAPEPDPSDDDDEATRELHDNSLSVGDDALDAVLDGEPEPES